MPIVKNVCISVFIFFSSFAYADSSAVKTAQLVQKNINSIQWVVVDGMFSDLITTEVSLIPQVLKNTYGIHDVSLVRPSSFDGLENQTRFLYQMSINQYKKNNKKIVFLAQSRGAQILFHTFLKYPRLIDITYKSIYIQGAFYGSPLADISLDSIQKISKGNTSLHRQIQDLIKLLSPSAEDLRSDKARFDLIRNIQNAYKIAPLKINDMKSNFWFIRSQKTTYKLKPNLIPSGLYLSRYFGENDGVVLTSEQIVPGWGIDIGVMPMGHLFVAKDPSRAGADTLSVIENIIELIRFDLAH